jgi:hypothetical protein
MQNAFGALKLFLANKLVVTSLPIFPTKSRSSLTALLTSQFIILLSSQIVPPAARIAIFLLALAFGAGGKYVGPVDIFTVGTGSKNVLFFGLYPSCVSILDFGVDEFIIFKLIGKIAASDMNEGLNLTTKIQSFKPTVSQVVRAVGKRVTPSGGRGFDPESEHSGFSKLLKEIVLKRSGVSGDSGLCGQAHKYVLLACGNFKLKLCVD